MIKEIAVGGALAVLIYLGLNGLNLMPFLFLGGLLYVPSRSGALRSIRRDNRPLPRRAAGRVSFAQVGG